MFAEMPGSGSQTGAQRTRWPGARKRADAYARGMVSRRRGRAAAGLVVLPALIVSLAGCTGSSGRPFAAGSPAATGRSVASGVPEYMVCTRAEIHAAMSRFFDTWNHRDAAALALLFTTYGVLDMATKTQGAGEWTTTGGPGAGRLIAAFAERQWRLGETLSYRSIWAAATTTAAGPEADGGGARIVAKFADGTVQPITYDKFIYDCPAHAFSHAVMTAAKAAEPA